MNSTQEHDPRKLVEKALWLYASLLLALNALSWDSYYSAGKAPLRRPLFEPSDQFRDLTGYVDKIAHLDRGAAALAHGLPVYNYPAPAAYLYAFFLRGFPQNPVPAYLAIISAGLLCGVFLLWRAARSSQCSVRPVLAAALVTAGLGSPLLFALDRGNLEGAVGLILGAGLVLFAACRYYGAAALIGLAASIKPFPGLFLLLLFHRKLRRQFAVGVAVAVGSVLIALHALGPTTFTAYKDLQPGVKDYFDNYVMKVPMPQEGRFDHSLMDTLKLVVNKASSRAVIRNAPHGEAASPAFLSQHVYDHDPNGLVPRAATSDQLKHMRAILLIAMLLAAIGLIYAVRGVYQLPVVNQMILIATAITLFPPLAAEYTLLHLYVPFGLFILFLSKGVATGCVHFSRSCLAGFLILFALLFSPLSFLAGYAGSAKTLALIALLALAGRIPMPTSLFGEALTPQPRT